MNLIDPDGRAARDPGDYCWAALTEGQLSLAFGTIGSFIRNLFFVGEISISETTRSNGIVNETSSETTTSGNATEEYTSSTESTTSTGVTSNVGPVQVDVYTNKVDISGDARLFSIGLSIDSDNGNNSASVMVNRNVTGNTSVGVGIDTDGNLIMSVNNDRTAQGKEIDTNVTRKVSPSSVMKSTAKDMVNLENSIHN